MESVKHPIMARENQKEESEISIVQEYKDYR